MKHAKPTSKWPVLALHLQEELLAYIGEKARAAAVSRSAVARAMLHKAMELESRKSKA